MRKTPYDPVKSFEPVARVGDLVCGFVIHPAVGPKTFKEMIEYAKANPGKLSYGSAGLGTSTHLRIEMLKYRAGIDILHVPYRGSADALNDLLPNTVQMMNEINVLPHVKAGKLILLDINYSRATPGVPRRPDADRARLAQLRCADLVLDPGARRARRRTSSPSSTPRSIEIAKTDEMKARMQCDQRRRAGPDARGDDQAPGRGHSAATAK